uniref:Uncharacterized protein n=1 Tax=Setaria digitata TaxID=48799 RepID=A0A915PEL4_9BILA
MDLLAVGDETKDEIRSSVTGMLLQKVTYRRKRFNFSKDPNLTYLTTLSINRWLDICEIVCLVRCDEQA